MSPRRIAFWLLVTAGVAVGHVAGYAAAHPEAAAREAALGGHAYLPPLAAAIIPLGVVAALVWAVRTARELGLAGQIRWSHLALAQVAVFAVQEVGERVVVGGAATDALAERGVWFGLVAQLLVAFVITRAIDLVRRTVRFVLAGGRRTVSLPRTSGSRTTVLPPVLRPATVAVGLRAPPLVGSSH